jgi:hypothetical protein
MVATSGSSNSDGLLPQIVAVFFGVDVPASLDIQAAGALRHSGKSGVGALGDDDLT